MWLAIFVIITLLLIALPLMPAIMELQLATDVKPLKVTQDYDSNVKHFAIGFRSYIEKNFASLFAVGIARENQPKEGILRDKTPFIFTADDGNLILDNKESKRKAVKRLVVAEYPITLPSDTLFESEIYSKSSVTSGNGSRFRAILAEDNITLGERNVVYRWIHSGHTLSIGSGCNLFGRASADEVIQVTGNCEFERLNAPKIIFGKDNLLPMPDNAHHNLDILEKLPHVKDQFERRWLINGNVKIPPGHLFEGDIVATKSVTIGAGSVIRGSIKATYHLVIEDNVIIYGSAISAGDIVTGDKCIISELVLAEGNAVIGTDNIIGFLDKPITLAAKTLSIKNGTVVYGSVRAEEKAAAVITSLKAKL